MNVDEQILAELKAIRGLLELQAEPIVELKRQQLVAAGPKVRKAVSKSVLVEARAKFRGSR